MPRPLSATVRNSCAISSTLASRLGTGRPKAPTWVGAWDDDRPRAPASRPSRTTARMSASSPSVAGRDVAASAPMTNSRTMLWGTIVATFSRFGRASRTSRYSG